MVSLIPSFITYPGGVTTFNLLLGKWFTAKIFINKNVKDTAAYTPTPTPTLTQTLP
jgi:hypothetical protein